MTNKEALKETLFIFGGVFIGLIIITLLFLPMIIFESIYLGILGGFLGIIILFFIIYHDAKEAQG